MGRIKCGKWIIFFLSLQLYGMSGQCNSKEEKKWNENTVEPARVQWTGSISYPSIQDAESVFCAVQKQKYENKPIHTWSHEGSHDLKIALDWVTIYEFCTVFFCAE